MEKSTDWEQHKLLIMKTLAALESDYKSLENIFLTFRLDSREEFHKFSSDIEKKLKIMSDDILKIQIKFGLVMSGISVVMSILTQVVIKILLQ